MRTIELCDGDLTDSRNAHVDWKEQPADMLASVDGQLLIHGLEVVMINTGSDDYMWRIEKRQKPAAG